MESGVCPGVEMMRNVLPSRSESASCRRILSSCFNQLISVEDLVASGQISLMRISSQSTSLPSACVSTGWGYL